MSIISRDTYIGGSDAASILGKNRYRSRSQAWKQKREGLDLDLSGNTHVQRGVLIEPLIEKYVFENIDPTVNSEDNWRKHDVGRAERRYSHVPTDTQIMLLDDKVHPISGERYIGGHPDGVGDEILWEFKAPTSYKIAMIARMGLPPSWFYQVQHYLKITGLPMGKVAIWDCDKWEPIIIDVPPNRDIHIAMDEMYEEFWANVLVGTEPNDYDETNYEELEHTAEEIDRVLAEYAAATSARYDGERDQKELRMQIMTMAKGRPKLAGDVYTADIQEKKRYGKAYTQLTVSENF